MNAAHLESDALNGSNVGKKINFNDEFTVSDINESVDLLPQKLSEFIVFPKADSSSDLTTSSSGSNSPSSIPPPLSTSTSSSDITVSSLSSPKSNSIENFDPKLLTDFHDAIRTKNFELANALVKCIPNWKTTFLPRNCSVLSDFSKYARKQLLGKLKKSDGLFMFAPLIQGANQKLAGGYLSALALYIPDIQLNVISNLICSAPYLIGFVLQSSIYYNLHYSVINFLLTFNPVIKFHKRNYDGPGILRSIPFIDDESSIEDIEAHLSVGKSFFMNFHDGNSVFSSWESFTSSDPEVNFLHGMLESAPQEIGVMRSAFENYTPDIVMALIDLCPFKEMAKYHLAHLIAKNPEKKAGYPNLSELIKPGNVFERMQNGETDLVALALLSELAPSEQQRKLSEFLSKTNMLQRIHKDKTLSLNTSPDFFATTGIYELPNNPAHLFFLTACKWNIDDAAFFMLVHYCSRINIKSFLASRELGLKWFVQNNLGNKIKILSPETNRK